MPYAVLARASFGTSRAAARLDARARRLRLVRHPDLDRRAGALTLLGIFLGAICEGDRCRARHRPGQLLAFAASGVQLFFVRKGLVTIRRLETWTAPLKILVCAALVWWAIDRAGGVGPIFAAPSAFVPGGARAGQFWLVFWPALTAMIGYWATLALNIPDFTRFAKSKGPDHRQSGGLPPMWADRAGQRDHHLAPIVIYGRAMGSVELAAPCGTFVLLGMIVISIDPPCNIAAHMVSSAPISPRGPAKISYRTGG